MKNTTLFLLALIVFSNRAWAQPGREIFDPKINLTWLGLDFSSVKFIGDRERLTNESDLRKLIKA